MFTEQILKSIISLKSFSSPSRSATPALEGIYISVDGATKTITAIATDSRAVARMTISVPEYTGKSWSQNVSIPTLNAALATVKATGRPVSAFPEAHMPEFPARAVGLVDKYIASGNLEGPRCFNAKYLGALSKVNVGGDKSGRWALRTASHYRAVILVATSSYGEYDVAVVTPGIV